MLKGTTVKLYKRMQTGVDGFGRPVYSETAVEVDNVLIAPMTETEIINTTNLTGRKAVYQLGISKGNTDKWANCTVEFFGKKWKVIGDVIEGIEDLIPLQWNKKVRVEEYNE